MNVADLIRASEGVRLAAYDDSSGETIDVGDVCRGTLTIGIGHCGPDVHPGQTITRAEAEYRLAVDIETATAAAAKVLGQTAWDGLDEVRRAAVIDCVFNLGQRGFSKFTHTIAAIRSGDYERAALLMLASKWAGQVGRRAVRDAAMMRLGKWPEKA